MTKSEAPVAEDVAEDVVIQPESEAAKKWVTPLRVIGGLALAGALVSGPAIAIEAGSAFYEGQVTIAGQTVSYVPKIGWNYSRVNLGAIRPEHASVLGINIGVDANVDLSNISTDEHTRIALSRVRDDPDPEKARLEESIKNYVLLLGASGLAAAGVMEGGIFLTRRIWHNYIKTFGELTPQQARFHKNFRRVGLGTASILLAGINVAGANILMHEDNHTVMPNRTLLSYGIPNTELTGIVNEASPYLQLLLPESHFDDRVDKNLKAALADRKDLLPQDDELSIMVIEDLQGNYGTARITSTTASLVEADIIANTGDLSVGGTSVESIIYEPMVYYAKGIPIYISSGKHDTERFLDYARERDITVGDGDTTEVEGIPMQFVPDPEVSSAVVNFGGGNVLRDPDVSVDEAISKAIDESCESHPVFTFTHDHAQGRRIAEAGCSSFVIDGRSYKIVGPQTIQGKYGTVTEFTSGSAGGYRDTKANFGPIQNPATYSLFKYNKLTGAAHYAVFTVNPDASVEVSPLINTNIPYDLFLKTGQTEPPHIVKYDNKPQLLGGNEAAPKRR